MQAPIFRGGIPSPGVADRPGPKNLFLSIGVFPIDAESAVVYNFGAKSCAADLPRLW